MKIEDLFESGGRKAASQAYWNALKTLRAAWKEVFDEDLPTEGNSAKSAFQQAIGQVRQRLGTDAVGDERLRSELDVDPKEDIAEALLNYADVDDLSPKAVKSALAEECVRLGDGRHELRALLRPVLDNLFADTGTRRPRVGSNRHWPRLLQYLREIEKETDRSPTRRGLHLMNSGGGGRVAREPHDPAALAIRIRTEHLQSTPVVQV